ncbi:hypothetical protein FY034_18040 (plasmid) [Trichlorobacter lovleyi]|uniref:hypothetical protein n=1 Tax=Trichlorobacter lovleyi TaxID=313985 RepID=UPI00223F153B|nr:hypothetical protein [Trichlorobacter lovleyi]QOX80902.1 hypothetical protein FY034_18040 [Trichlorobacter lovleyi]
MNKSNFLSIPGVPYPVLPADRVITNKDVFRCDGETKVAKGAIGTIVCRNGSICTVLFDPESTKLVGPGYKDHPYTGCKYQDVPFLNLDTLEVPHG